MTLYYPTIQHSRLLSDADLSVLTVADDADLGGFTPGKFILAIMVGYNGKDTTASAYKLQWRDVTDGGSFTGGGTNGGDVAATGEIKYSATSTAITTDDASFTQTSMKCTNMDSTMTWQNGLSNVGDNTLPDSGTYDLGSDCYTEFHWALDASDGTAGHQYEFRLWNNTSGVTSGTCAAKITLALMTPKAVAGNLKPAKAVPRKASIIEKFSGGFKPAGLAVVAGRFSKVLLAVLNASGYLGTSTIVGMQTQLCTGAIRVVGVLDYITSAPLGVIFKATRTTTAGVGKWSGTIGFLQRLSRLMSGEGKLSGVAYKVVGAKLLGGLKPAAIISTISRFLSTVAGGLKPAGQEFARTIKAAFLAVLGMVGSGTGQIVSGAQNLTKDLARTLYSSGVVARSLKAYRTLTGGVYPAGIVSTISRFLKVVAGGVYPAGAVGRISRFLKAVAGGVKPAGIYRAGIQTSLAGLLKTSAILPLRTIKAPFTAGLKPTGVITGIKKALKSISGGLYPAGVVAPLARFSKTLLAGLRSTGATIRTVSSRLYGGIQFAGGLLPLSVREIGYLTKQVFKHTAAGQRFVSDVYKMAGAKVAGSWRGAGSSLYELMIGGFHQYTKAVGGVLFKAAIYGTGILYGTGIQYAGSAGQVTKRVFTKFTSFLRTSGFLGTVKIISSFITYYQDVSGVIRSSGRNIFDIVSNQFGGLKQSGYNTIQSALNLLAGLKPTGKINTDTVLSGLGGGLKPVSDTFKSVATSLYSYLFTSGFLSYIRYHFNLNYNKDLFRTLWMSGNVFKDIPGVLSRALSVSGTVSVQGLKLLVGGIKPASDLFRLISTSLYGGQKFISDLVRQAGALQTKLLVGGLRLVGNVPIHTSKLLDAGIRVTGNLVNQVELVLSGGLKAVGLLAGQMDKLLAGGFQSSGVVVNIANKLVGGILQSSSDIVRFIRTRLTTVLELFGYVMKAAPGNLRQDHSLYNLLPLSQRPLIWDNWVSLQPLHIKQVIQ